MKGSALILVVTFPKKSLRLHLLFCFVFLLFISAASYQDPMVLSIIVLFTIVVTWLLIISDFKTFTLYEDKLEITSEACPFCKTSQFSLVEIDQIEINIHLLRSSPTFRVHLKNGKTKIFGFHFEKNSFQNFIDAIRDLGILVIVNRSYGELK